MAVHTVGRNAGAQAGELAALFRLMAGEANGGEGRCVALRLVNVVAGGAGYCALLEAEAALEELDLVAVHIDRKGGVHRRDLEIAIKRFARLEGKRWCQGFAEPRMAEGTGVDLAVTGKGGEVEEGFCGRRFGGSSRVLGVEGRVGAGRAMTALTGNAKDERGAVEAVGGRGKGLE